MIQSVALRYLRRYTPKMADEILFDVDEYGIATLTVNRPFARNALSWAAQEQFAESVKAVSQNPAIRVLIITGAGEKAFVSGGDLKELVNYPKREDAQRLKQTMGDALEQLTQLPIPVIAAVNGDAFGGGCELLTACDLRIASAHARFCFAQIKNGLTSGWGATGRLVPLIGKSLALELMLSGRVFDSVEAKQMGFIHRVTDQAVRAAAHEWAQEFVKLPQNALASIKQLVNTAVTASPQEIKATEEALFLDLWTHPNHQEAVEAFLEKRPPKFN